MENQKRTRAVILAISFLLLAGGGVGYYTYQTNRDADQGLAGLPDGGHPPNTQTGTEGVPAQGGDQGLAGSTAPGPAVATQPPPAAATPQPAQSQATAPAAANPAPTVPAVQTAPPAPVASKPPVAAPAQNATAALPSAGAGKLAQASQEQPPAAKVQTPAAPTKSGESTGEPAIAKAPEPEAPRALNKSIMGDRTKIVASTRFNEASGIAKMSAGRQDPMMAPPLVAEFPRFSKKDEPPEEGKDGNPSIPPPPPTDLAMKSKNSKLPGPPPMPSGGGGLLKPPPPPMNLEPGVSGAAVAGGSPLDVLPLPPDKPSILDKLRLTAVMDNRAILTVNNEEVMLKKWPRTIILGPGEQFESVTLVSVNKDGITLEEDGERSNKTLPEIK